MAKSRSVYVCNNCGFKTSSWQGKCPSCSQWNTLAEVLAPAGSSQSSTAKPGVVVRLSELEEQNLARFSTGSTEFDEVLGGGIVPGSLILLGGDPGIGKSTLALQAAVNISKAGKKVLYVSGEESAHQINLRKNRLDNKTDLLILPETDLATILATLASETPDFVIIDSIQTVRAEEVNGVVGGVSQIAFGTNSLMRAAKFSHCAILIIGHVTKEGMLAGPKTLEHMVDTVLYLEGERFMSLRLLRCNKNRFGSSGEVGVFEMNEQGLKQVLNPSLFFLENRDVSLPGSCITATLEGNKVLLLEVQGLTNPSNFGYPKRTTSGFDLNRLQLILAILQKTLKATVATSDVYVNVAGGFNASERAIDLPAALAILSSYKNKALPKGTVAIGELGLLGEIRGVSQIETRLKEAEKLGFTKVICGGPVRDDLIKKYKKLEISFVRQVKDLEKLF